MIAATNMLNAVKSIHFIDFHVSVNRTSTSENCVQVDNIAFINISISVIDTDGSILETVFFAVRVNS
jgi:hypothetical protein